MHYLPLTFHLVPNYGAGREPILKKCDIKGDNLSVMGPTKNLYDYFQIV